MTNGQVYRKKTPIPPTICCSVLKQIADVFLKEILEKMDAAKKLLSI
jgi:hypothetical protein